MVFPSQNLSGFDEPTQAEVTMTESRTRCASRGIGNIEKEKAIVGPPAEERVKQHNLQIW